MGKIAKKDNRLKKTYNVIVLDKSGSMESVRDATRVGFNEYVQEMKKVAKKHVDQEFYASLITFNSSSDIIFFNMPVDEIDELKEKDYCPSGSTAMWDAIGVAIDSMEKDIHDELVENDIVDAKVVVNIFTDGYENASSEENRKIVPSRKKELEKSGNWVFSFIGTDIDVEKEALKMGIAHGSSVSYNKTAIGTRSAFVGSVQAMDSYACKRTSGMSDQLLNENYYTNPDGSKIDLGKIEESLSEEKNDLGLLEEKESPHS